METKEIKKHADELKLKGLTFDEEQRWLNANKSKGTMKYYDCPECLNKGFIFNKDGSALECKCMKIRKTYKYLEEDGVLDQVKKSTFDSFETKEKWQEQMKEYALEFIKSKDATLFLLGGQSGSGKSHICSAIVNELTTKEFKLARYIKWSIESKMLIALKSSGDKEKINAYIDRMEEIKQCSILYIDDLLKTPNLTKPSEAQIALAFDIIDSRYNNKNKITIISTEWGKKELVEMDEALGSRIYEMSKYGKYAISIQRRSDRNYRLKYENREL